MSQPISHGRGGKCSILGIYQIELTVAGAANIRPDETVYADGEIIREGAVGDQGDGMYSTGRGGTGNISGKPVDVVGQPHDETIVPETATRLSKEESHHYGRGGQGNVQHVHEKKEKESLLDKAKHALHMDKK
jgi:Protein of unknown function (DUF3602)